MSAPTSTPVLIALLLAATPALAAFGAVDAVTDTALADSNETTEDTLESTLDGDPDADGDLANTTDEDRLDPTSSLPTNASLEAPTIPGTDPLTPGEQARADANRTLLSVMLELREALAASEREHEATLAALTARFQQGVQDVRASMGACLAQAFTLPDRLQAYHAGLACREQGLDAMRELRSELAPQREQIKADTRERMLDQVRSTCDELDQRLEEIRTRYRIDADEIVLDPSRYEICKRAR